MSKPDNNNRELQKVLRSPEYRKRVKRLIALVKTLRDIPWGQKIPKRKHLKASASDKEKELFMKTDGHKPDLDMIHYFCQVQSYSPERRSAQPTPTEQVTA